MEYKHDIFYKISDLPIEKIKELFDKAKKLSFNWWVDKLDYSEGYRRQKIEMSFGDIMKKLDKSCHIVFIHRRGYWDWLGEMGFVTMTGEVSYYLFIDVTEDNMEKLINEYKLKPLQ